MSSSSPALWIFPAFWPFLSSLVILTWQCHCLPQWELVFEQSPPSFCGDRGQTWQRVHRDATDVSQQELGLFLFFPHVNWKLFSVSIILIGGMKPEDVTHNYKCNDWKVCLKGLGEWVRKKTLTDPKIFLRLKYSDAFLQWWYQWWIFNTV